MRIDEIRKRLKGGLGREILYYDTVDSTNSVALTLAGKNAEGLVILSDSQEKGRGRLGRPWVSPPGVNIYMSIVLKPEIKPADATLITLTAAVACATALRRVTGLDIRIKWPNDLVVSDKKVGGILTELRTLRKKIVFAIVGIGINVNIDVDSFPSDIRSIATSVKNETGKTSSREAIIAEVLGEIERWYPILKRTDRAVILDAWRQLNSTLGRRVLAVTSEGAYRGTAESIDDEGTLLLRLPSGEVKKVGSGDLTILR